MASPSHYASHSMRSHFSKLYKITFFGTCAVLLGASVYYFAPKLIKLN